MLKLFLVMALMFLLLSVPYGILCFAAARWGLQRRTLRFRRGVRVCLLIGLALLAAGMAYGLLRYCGVLVFPDDDPSSIHLFNSSGGDEGFQYLYMCGTVFLGILAALRQERAAHPADPLHTVRATFTAHGVPSVICFFILNWSPSEKWFLFRCCFVIRLLIPDRLTDDRH